MVEIGDVLRPKFVNLWNFIAFTQNQIIMADSYGTFWTSLAIKHWQKARMINQQNKWI